MLRDQVIAALRNAAPGLAREFGVASLSLFGSVARGEERASSDVDILVSFEPTARVTLVTLSRLRDTLETLLGRPVDIVEDHPHLRPSLRRGIEQDRLRVA